LLGQVIVSNKVALITTTAAFSPVPASTEAMPHPPVPGKKRESFFDGAKLARCARLLMALAETKNASIEDGDNLVAALRWVHYGRVVQHIGHCGLLADVPTTAFTWPRARVSGGFIDKDDARVLINYPA